MLPDELIAQEPAATRSASRLLELKQGEDRRALLVDRQFQDIVQLLDPGDLVVVNDTRVVKARLTGAKPSGGRVEVLVERVTGEKECLAMVRASRSPRAGTPLILSGGTKVMVGGRSGSFFRLTLEQGSWDELMAASGQLPLPPYITRTDGPGPEDEERYQTIFARAAGAVAAPTAGLHFDAGLVEQLRERGIAVHSLTLHVGAGTFEPVRVEDIDEHRMHSERFAVTPGLCDAIAACRDAGRRVVAVGTTVVRALESAIQRSPEHLRRQRVPQACEGETDIFITPGYRFGLVDCLVTNFHLPQSTLMMLVSAFSGYEPIMQAYRHAVAQRYRFFSYGDAMFLHGAHAAGTGSPGDA